MFEKFTENAINLITEAQNQAKLLNNAYVQPEHLLIAMVKQAKGISLRLFRNCNITLEAVTKEVENRLRFEKTQKELPLVPFGEEFKNLLKDAVGLAKRSGSSYILFEHLFIVTIQDKFSYNSRILENFKFDVKNAGEILLKLVQKKYKKLSHPEIEDLEETEEKNLNPEQFFEDESAFKIFSNALAKLQNSGYEILGTEQIISAILAEKNFEVARILEENGINLEVFEKKLLEVTSREAEYDKNRVVFTPSAFIAMDLASLTAKELGSPIIKPEHIFLGLLKAKRGVAYDILKSLNVNDEDLIQEILKPIEKQIPQALTVLRLAKQEAGRLERNVVGSEMILLGIMSEGTGIGFQVLNDLEITLKDLRQTIEKLIGYGHEYSENEIIFTGRAKKILEVAWKKAKKYRKPRIMSEHLLYAITTEPSSVAMKALEQLGTDAVEIRQGILQRVT
ncbi:MAG: Clp protease N-terminal domain-containing protein [Candidatus Gastranaerophilales bacterium]|nr:Clp protease N-terminal domain-containing protein [Candidatus Gastranaerophilales bacterium]